MASTVGAAVGSARTNAFRGFDRFFTAMESLQSPLVIENFFFVVKKVIVLMINCM